MSDLPEYPETERFGLTRIGPSEQRSKNNHAALNEDRLTLDDILYALESHTHDAAPRLADPANAPDAEIDPVLAGSLPADTVLYYRVGYLDRWGLETAMSPEVEVATPPPVETPSPPTLSTSSTGGSKVPGSYAYAISAYDEHGGETRVSTLSRIVVPAGTNTNQITLTFPDLPAGAEGWRVYRSRPGQTELYRLAQITGAVFVDDGSPEDQSVRAPTRNTTNNHNAVRVYFPETELPDGVMAWRIYRTTVPGNYGGNSLVHEVVEPEAPGSLDVRLDWVDDGTSLRPGRPRLRSSTISGGSTIELGQLLGRFPISASPRGSRSLSVFVDEMIDDQELLVTEPPGEVIPVRMDVSFATPPSGVDANNHAIVRLSTAQDSIEVPCDSDVAHHSVTFPLTDGGKHEAEAGERYPEGTVPIVTDQDASSSQAVLLANDGDGIEIDLGHLDAGDYGTGVRVRATDTAELTITVEIDEADETPAVEPLVESAFDDVEGPGFALADPADVKVRIERTGGPGEIVVDYMTFEGTTVTLEGVVTVSTHIEGTPASPGGGANVIVWF